MVVNSLMGASVAVALSASSASALMESIFRRCMFVGASSTAAVRVGKASTVAATRRKVVTKSALIVGMPVLENMLEAATANGNAF